MPASSHRQPHESTHKSSKMALERAWTAALKGCATVILKRAHNDSAFMVKRFAAFEFDDQRRTLTSGGQPVKLSGQALDLLALLLERPGQLVTRGEIERRLWPDRTVEFDHGLDVVVSRLRAILGENSSEACVETVPRRGYRLVAPVTVATEQRRRSRGARRALTYAAIAVLAAMLTILIARSRYDRFVPPAPVAQP